MPSLQERQGFTADNRVATEQVSLRHLQLLGGVNLMWELPKGLSWK